MDDADGMLRSTSSSVCSLRDSAVERQAFLLIEQNKEFGSRFVAWSRLVVRYGLVAALGAVAGRTLTCRQ